MHAESADQLHFHCASQKRSSQPCCAPLSSNSPASRAVQYSPWNTQASRSSTGSRSLRNHRGGGSPAGTRARSYQRRHPIRARARSSSSSSRAKQQSAKTLPISPASFRSFRTARCLTSSLCFSSAASVMLPSSMARTSGLSVVSVGAGSPITPPSRRAGPGLWFRPMANSVKLYWRAESAGRGCARNSSAGSSPAHIRTQSRKHSSHVSS